MTEWEKLKVTDLKEELKARGIPLTGLKLKQQLIDKLNELDAESQNERDVGEEDPGNVEAQEERSPALEADDGNNEQPTHLLESNLHEQSTITTLYQAASVETDSSQPPADTVSTTDDNVKPQAETLEKGRTPSLPADETTGKERVERLPDDFPTELKNEESQARDGSSPAPAAAESALEDQVMKEDDPFIPQDTSEVDNLDTTTSDGPRNSESVQPMDFEASEISTRDSPSKAVQDQPTGSVRGSTSSSVEPLPEGVDDQRKRKRRSATPVPDSDDVARKRSKLSEGSTVTTDRESKLLERVQDVTDAAQAIRLPTDLRKDTRTRAPPPTVDENLIEQDENKVDYAGRSESITPQSQLDQRKLSRSPSRSSIDDDVVSAVHPATRSLYMRNFKRPLQIPTLRNHIATLAGNTRDDPIKTFYLDSIRTHAFVSLTSVSAAVRVRNAMHGTRFPDEPMREPLWIDFIPDEKVEEWIDQESGSGGGGLGGGRASSKKYEVVYDNYGNGIEAILQDQSDSQSQAQRPSFSQSRSNRMVLQDPTAAATVTSGIHPSRAALVPQSPSMSYSQPAPKPPTRPSDPGKGFRALDELFSSTTAKPKLYYKLPAQAIIDDRLDMIRGLRVNHEEMGQSGDEGMKRYTFERDDRSGRDEWVDKGPEFGFGRRGQERLTGFGNTYGNPRARGGFRGARRGGDSWRGR